MSRGRGRGRGTEREREADSLLSAELNAGLDLKTLTEPPRCPTARSFLKE